MSTDTAGSVAVVDTRWRIGGSGGVCRYPKCREPAVAQMHRLRSRRGGRWYSYCPDHLYGRWIEDGKVWVNVAKGSPAAKQGHV